MSAIGGTVHLYKARRVNASLLSPKTQEEIETLAKFEFVGPDTPAVLNMLQDVLNTLKERYQAEQEILGRVPTPPERRYVEPIPPGYDPNEENVENDDLPVPRRR